MSGIAEKERAEIVKMLKAEVRKMRAGAREYAKARTIGGYAVAAMVGAAFCLTGAGGLLILDRAATAAPSKGPL